MGNLKRSAALAVAVLLSAPGCSDDDGEPVTSLYVVPESLDALEGESFLDHPFPSDLRLEDGSPRYKGFHNPRSVPLVGEYVDAAAGILDGFSPVAAGYLRFQGPVDPASLPQGAPASLSPDASVQLIDVDPDSPEFGLRKQINTSFRAAAGHYVLPNTLRWMPALGFPLRPATRYAVLTTRALRSAAGGESQAGENLRQVLGLAPASGATEALRSAWSADVGHLEQAGIVLDDVSHLAVFTTADPTAELRRFANHLRTEVPAPEFRNRTPWSVFKRSGFVEYIGQYGPSPNYQRGNLPFAILGDGGELNEVDGQPEVVDYFDLRFSLSVPNTSDCPMPEAGYPVVMYAHGTGGGYRSYLNGGYAKLLGVRCIASMGVDQIFHGTRPGAPDDTTSVQLLFFNVQNVHAARSNGRQSALDEIQRARLFTEAMATIPARISHTGETIRFDPDKVMFFGHSQGGLNGPLYLALDNSARGGVLSGSGSVFSITLLEKTEPAPSVASLVRTIFLALTVEEQEELDLFHPAISLSQSLVDVIDPIHYVRHIVREPLPGNLPKSILMTEGISPDGRMDSYTPPRGTEAQAVAMGLPLQLPAQVPLEMYGAGMPPPVTIPPGGLSGNLAGGVASGVLAQWAPIPGEDGHFVVFDVEAARVQTSEFLRLLAADPHGLVPAP